MASLVTLLFRGQKFSRNRRQFPTTLGTQGAGALRTQLTAVCPQLLEGPSSGKNRSPDFARKTLLLGSSFKLFAPNTNYSIRYQYSLQNLSKLLIPRPYFHEYFCIFTDILKYGLHIQTYNIQKLDVKHSAYINKHEMGLTFSILISDANNLIISHFELNSLEMDNFGKIEC